MNADIAFLIFVAASLLVAAALAQPLAERLRLPVSVLLAGIGIVIGILSGTDVLFRFLPVDQMEPAADLVTQMAAIPLTADVILYLFLPVLLFQTAITVDVRRMFDDLAPILLMAVGAVVVCTGVVGWSLSWVSGEPLLVCLLVGAIVATTDPVAVVSIFRDLGAPRRLSVLVEGESLLNDAAAIALTTLFLAALTEGASIHLGGLVGDFFILFIGGAVVGWAIARLTLRLMTVLRGYPLAEITLTVALAYVSFIVAERFFGVSGVVATVVAGLVTASTGRTLVTPSTWPGLETVWTQLGYWASTLVFIIAATFVPRFLATATWFDVLGVLAIVVAALVARAVVLWGLIPPLVALGMAEPLRRSHRVVMLWGGLRGAVTLALALAVTENPDLPEFFRSFVAISATGFVLVTLLGNATTLRPLIRLLKLDALTPLDLALRNRVIGIALEEIEDRLGSIAARHRLNPRQVDRLVDETRYELECLRSVASADELPLSAEEQLRLGLTALSVREEELYLHHYGQGTISRRVLPFLRAKAGRLFDAGRSGGRDGYLSKAQDSLRFRARFQAGQWAHRSLGISALLARSLSERFETVLVTRIVLEELNSYVIAKLGPLLGGHVSGQLREVVAVRLASCEQALSAMRLQYPDYADAQERGFLRHVAVRLEEERTRQLAEEAVIGKEAMRDLLKQLKTALGGREERNSLDLGLSSEQMVRRVDLFRDFPEDRIRGLAKLLQPVLAVPGEVLIREGERGNEMYFIATGAVEVLVKQHHLRLGTGEFFGELALLRNRRRTATVTAIDYCRLLRLRGRDFRQFLRQNPEARDQLRAVAEQRAQERRLFQEELDADR